MADELRTVLGFDASQAISTLIKLDAQLASFTTTMTVAADSTHVFNTAAKGVDATLGQLSGAQRTAIASSNNFAATIKKLQNQVARLEAKLEKLKKKTVKSTKQMMLSWQSMARIFAIQTIHQAISKVTSALADSVREAMSLEIALAEIQTIAKPLRGDFEGVAASVRKLSNEFGISRDIVAEGVYQTLSNQIAQGADAFDFFKDAADLSIGAVMSADAAVNLLSSTINSFGFSANQAATISGKLFKTIELGRLRGEEFANTIGRVYVLADQLGVSLDDANAALATLTISGLKYNEAATLTTNVMLKLIRPTDTLKKLMNDLNIASAEAGIAAFGFQGFLQLLRDEAGDTAESLGLVFGRVRAIRGIMGLTNKATEKYQKTLEALKKAGGEDILGAKELIFKTNAKQVEIELNALKNAIVFDFGRTALEVIGKVFKAFGGAVNIVKGLTATVGVLALGATVLGAIYFPWVAVFAAVAVSVGVVTTALGKMYTTANTKLKRHIKLQEEAVAKAKKDASDLTELQILELGKQFAALQKYIIKLKGGTKQIMEDAVFKEEFLSKILYQQLDDRASAWDSFVDAIEDKIADSADAIEDSQKKIFDIQREIANFDFETSIEGKDPRKQSFAALDESSDLLRKAAHAFREGRTGMAAGLLGDAKSMAKLAKSSADAAENASLEHKARDQMRAVLKAQLNQQEQIRKQIQTQAQEATSIFGQTKSRAERINKIIEDMKTVQIFGPKGEQKLSADEVKTELQRLAKALQHELDQVKIGKGLIDRLGLQKVFTAATKDFENLLTKEPVSLKFAVDQYIDESLSAITAYSEKNPVPVNVQLLFEKIDIDLSTVAGVEAAAQKLVVLKDEIEGIKHKLLDVKGSQDAFTNAIKNSAMAGLNLGAAIEKAKKDQQRLLRMAESQPWFGQEKAIAKVKIRLADLNTILPNVQDALANLRRSMEGEEIDTNMYENAITQLGIYIDQAKTAGLTDFVDHIAQAVAELQKASTAAAGAVLEKVYEKDIREAESKYDAIQKALEGLGDAAAVGASGVNIASTQMVSAAERAETAWKKASLAMASAGGTPMLAHFGKMIYRASGGDARGTDTIPAMLSPGEFVMNAQSTKRFYSQLVAMNSGKSPVYRERGGSVTNVGDVNITVSGAAAPKQTARETMKAFRREMRRHTSTF